jgi:5-methylcytosine-specific restriction enzyme subunit McrC
MTAQGNALSSTYTIVEFGRIQQGEFAKNSLVDCKVNNQFWNELKAYVASAADEGEKAVLRWRGASNGDVCLAAGNYIGVLATPAGTLEILPKLAKAGRGDLDNQPDNLRKVVQHMLASVPELPFRETATAEQGQQDDTLFEWFIARFLSKVLHVVRRGIRSSYETLEDNLPFLRGRLVLSEHLRRNIADVSHLYVRFDEFTTNRPENRLIHAALHKAFSASRQQENRRLARELMAAFVVVPPSTNKQVDFKAWRLERGATHYTGLREWCLALLDPYSPTPIKGELKFESFLFPAETLFERYVAERLRQALRQPGGRGVNLQVQTQKRTLFTDNSRGPFGKSYGLRPDIVLRRPKIGRGYEVLICDAKWKLYETGDKNLGVAQGDLYQLFAYARYLCSEKDSVQLALIAPKGSALTQVTGPHRFNDGAQPRIDLWMVPYDLLVNFGSIPMGEGQATPEMGSLLSDVIQWHQAMLNPQQI